jgi:hypothetical protein
MSKVFLVVMIIYGNHPMTSYRGVTTGAEDCNAQAAALALKAPPDDDDVTKYTIGCSFEEPWLKVPIGQRK